MAGTGVIGHAHSHREQVCGVQADREAQTLYDGEKRRPDWAHGDMGVRDNNSNIKGNNILGGQFVADKTAQKSQSTLKAVLFGYPLLWLAGLGALFWPLLLLAVMPVLLRARHTKTTLIPILVAVTILFSSIIGTVIFGFQVDRILAMLFNVCVWVALSGTLLLTRLIRLDILLAKSIAITSVFQGLVILAAYIVFPSRLPFPILSSYAEATPAALSVFMTNNIMQLDWLGGIELRSRGIMGNPTWSGVFGAIAVLTAIGMYSRVSSRWRFTLLLGAAGGMIAMNFALSRSVQIAIIIAIGFGLFVFLRDRSPALFFLTATIGVIALCLVLLVGGEFITNYVVAINNDRAGSLESRSAIYEQTFQLIQKLHFPVFGYGIKPQVPGLVASLGTHSTYLGLIFRGGLSALALFLMIVTAVAIFAYRRRDFLATALITLIAAWTIFEDFDTGHWLPLALVLAYASSNVKPTKVESDRFDHPNSKSSRTF